MVQKSLIVSFAVALIMIVIAAPAWAECVQQDLTGKWSVKVCRGSLLGEPCWDDLTLFIDSDGVIKKGSFSNCQSQKGKVVGGQLTVSSGCGIKGMIQTDMEIVLVERGGFVDGTLVSGGKVQEIRWVGVGAPEGL